MTISTNCLRMLRTCDLHGVSEISSVSTKKLRVLVSPQQKSYDCKKIAIALQMLHVYCLSRILQIKKEHLLRIERDLELILLLAKQIYVPILCNTIKYKIDFKALVTIY